MYLSYCVCKYLFLLQKICADAKAHKRVLTSYEMMLDFYGMKLKNAETGKFILVMYTCTFKVYICM